MSHRATTNYIAAAGICFLSAAALIGCDTVTSSADRAAEVMSRSYSEIPEMDNDDTVIYDDVTPEFVLTYAENQVENYPTTQAGYYFAQLVNIRSEGRIQIRIYADSQLGDEDSTIEQARIGGIDFVRVSLATVTDFNEESIALMMPYIYRDSDHMWSVLLSEIGDRIIDGFAGSGITPLSWFDAGVRNLYFMQMVENMEDMQGLRIRVQNSHLMEDMIRQFGATPVPTDYEDVYSSLQQDAVDGAENNWSSYNSMNHNEVALYYMPDEHMRIPEMQLMSDITVSQLSDADMELIRQSAMDASRYERYLWGIYEENAEAEAIDQGTIVIDLTEEERQEFVNACMPLYEKYCSGFTDLVQEIQQMDSGL